MKSINLLDHLRRARTSSAMSCPSASELLRFGRRGEIKNGLDTDALALHLRQCAICARRWNQILEDDHILRSDLWVFARLSDSVMCGEAGGPEDATFLVTCVEEHLERCRTCAKRRRNVANTVVMDGRQLERNTGFSRMLKALAAESDEVLQTNGTRKILATVLDQGGLPKVTRGRLIHEVVDLEDAAISTEGRIRFVMRFGQEPVPPRRTGLGGLDPEPGRVPLQKVRLGLHGKEKFYVLPPLAPVERVVTFEAQTGTRGLSGKIPKSRISLWSSRY